MKTVSFDITLIPEKEIALARYNLVFLWKQEKRQLANSYWFYIITDFLSRYNTHEILQEENKIIGRVSETMLTEWELIFDRFRDPYILMPFMVKKFHENNPVLKNDITLNRYKLILHFIEFRIMNKEKFKVTDGLFIESYNRNKSFPEIFSAIGKVSLKTILRWYYRLKKTGNIFCLTPQWGKLNKNNKRETNAIQLD